MFVAVSNDCWGRWGTVIQHLAAEYDFPAATLEELNVRLNRYTGGGITFRLERERWKFVIDVTRRGHDIVDIVAITLIAKTIEDHRHNGAVITRACNIHPNTDEADYVGAPSLKWTMVTSGGMSFQHCCDKECAPPDRIFGTPQLNWETCRLKVIQKAYEQEVIALRAMPAGSALRRKLTNQSTELKLLEKVSQRRKEEVGQTKEALGRRKQQIADLRLAIKSTEHARQALKHKTNILEQQDQDKDITIFNQQREIAELLENHYRTENSLMDRERLQMRIAALDKENDVKEAIITNLRAELETLQLRKNGDGQQSITTPIRQEDVVELQQKIGRLERKKTKAASKIEYQKNQIAELSHRIEALEEQHDAAHEERLCEIQELQETNTKLQNELNTVITKHAKDQDAREQMPVWHGVDTQGRSMNITMETMKQKEKELVDKISQLDLDMQHKNDHGRRVETELHQLQQSSAEKIRRQTDYIEQLKREIRNKTDYIDRLQHLTTHTQTDLISMRTAHGMGDNSQASIVDFDRQQAALREAQERADDLESKLDGIKQVMKDKTEEMSDLKKKYADKIAAANAMEKRCVDKEACTANLEKKLEELRGTMETVLEGVSVHQGRKRRRTEGPDFQL